MPQYLIRTSNNLRTGEPIRILEDSSPQEVIDNYVLEFGIPNGEEIEVYEMIPVFIGQRFVDKN